MRRQRAQELIAAIGVDMTRFPSAAHVTSWTTLCPGTKESGGKRTPASFGKGNPYLRTTLIEAAWAATRTKTHLAAQYRRLAAMRGGKRAIVAVAHSILEACCWLMGVRVISRLLLQARPLIPKEVSQQLFRDRTRSAKRLSRTIGERAAPGNKREEEDPRVPLYRRLLAVARASLRQAQQIRAALTVAEGQQADHVRSRLDRVHPLVGRVIRQVERRVLQGQKVPATEKVLNLFEPRTALIRPGRVRQPTEFGRKVLLDEVEGGIITRYEILSGNPPDAPEFSTSLGHHRAQFTRTPDLVAADRSFWSPDDEQAAEAMGVHRGAIPRRGGTKAPCERARWFRRGHCFRLGIEGRISVLRRRFGLHRCRYHGSDGMERWVGFGILAHNLRTISRNVARRRAA